MTLSLQGDELPETEEEFEKFKQELIETSIASKQFIGNEKEITDAINAYLSTVPQFEGFFSIPLENELDKVDALLGQDTFSEIVCNLCNILYALKKALKRLKYNRQYEFENNMYIMVCV